MIHISVCKKTKTAMIMLEILVQSLFFLAVRHLGQLAVKYENRKDNVCVKITTACCGVARLLGSWNK
jgi:hypothetical protein